MQGPRRKIKPFGRLMIVLLIIGGLTLCITKAIQYSKGEPEATEYAAPKNEASEEKYTQPEPEPDPPPIQQPIVDGLNSAPLSLGWNVVVTNNKDYSRYEYEGQYWANDDVKMIIHWTDKYKMGLEAIFKTHLAGGTGCGCTADPVERVTYLKIIDFKNGATPQSLNKSESKEMKAAFRNWVNYMKYTETDDPKIDKFRKFANL